MDNFLWVEKYRPKTINDCILSNTIKGTLNDLVKEERVPNLMFTALPVLVKQLWPGQSVT